MTVEKELLNPGHSLALKGTTGSLICSRSSSDGRVVLSCFLSGTKLLAAFGFGMSSLLEPTSASVSGHLGPLTNFICYEARNAFRSRFSDYSPSVCMPGCVEGLAVYMFVGHGLFF